MGELFQKEGRNYYGNAFVTVTNVRVSPDLGVANIHISVFGVKDSNAVLEQIKKHTKEIRHLLGNSIRHQARIVPELKFFLDDSLDYVEKMERFAGWDLLNRFGLHLFIGFIFIRAFLMACNSMIYRKLFLSSYVTPRS